MSEEIIKSVEETKPVTETTVVTNQSQNGNLINQPTLVKENNETKQVENTKNETTISTEKKGGIKRIPAVEGTIEDKTSKDNSNESIMFIFMIGGIVIAILACLIVLIKRWN